MDSKVLERIRDLAESVCRDRGVDLFDVEFVGGSGHAVLRITIDEAKGISVEDCAAVSREMSTLLDVADPLPGRYRLEVSSPGIDRPIRHTQDAMAMIGKMVRIRTRRAIEGGRSFKGRLTAVRGEVWYVEMDGREFGIDVADVEKANMVFEFE